MNTKFSEAAAREMLVNEYKKLGIEAQAASLMKQGHQPGGVHYAAVQAIIAATGKHQVGEIPLSTQLAQAKVKIAALEFQLHLSTVGEVQGDGLAHALEVLRVVTGRAMQGSETQLAYETVSAALARQQSAGKVVGHVSRDSSKAHMCVNLPEGSPLYATAQGIDLGQFRDLADWALGSADGVNVLTQAHELLRLADQRDAAPVVE